MRLRAPLAFATLALVSLASGGAARAADLTLASGGRVALELLFSEADFRNSLAASAPGLSVIEPGGCGLELAVGLPFIHILSVRPSQRGCRVLLDADASVPGAQPFAAGTTFRFHFCSQTDADADCEFVWSSNPALNSDGFDHLRTTPVLPLVYPGRIFQLAWEDQPSGGDNDFDDLIAVLRVEGDADGDGLWDDWEQVGIDTDGNGSIDLDLPALGADPARKDIFLEIDYMVCSIAFGSLDCFNTPPHSHRPKPAAISRVVQAFASAPVANPDGSTGIDLHVDVSNGIEHQQYLALRENGCGDPVGNGIGSLDDVKADPVNFGPDNPRRFAYHYSLFGHRKSPTGRGRSSGCAELPGNDFLVTLGDWNTLCVAPGGDNVLNSTPGGDDVVISYVRGPSEIYTGNNLTCDTVVNANDAGFTPTEDVDGDGLSDLTVGTLLEQAGTLMHELGHNLQLRHGGGDEFNNKPNYLSVMNYFFQVDGIPTLTFLGRQSLIDYSGANLPELREAALNENLGIQDGANSRTRFFCPSGRIAGGAASGAIDWNCDGDGGVDPGVSVNVNGENPTNGTLAGFDDWAALRYDLQSARSFDDGSSESSETPVESQDEIQLAIPQLIQIDITPGELPNSINPRAKGRVPVAILSDPAFSAPQHVASDTLRFGRSGEEASLAYCNLGGEDVNGDGLLDLVCHFTRRQTGFAADSVVGTLRGQTIWGKTFEGAAPVHITSP